MNRKLSYLNLRSKNLSNGILYIENSEINLNKMHNTMITALKREADNELPRELEIANSVHKKELAEIKDKHQEAINALKTRIKELQAENMAIKEAASQLSMKNELIKREWKVKVEEMNEKHKEIEWRIKQSNEERKSQQLVPKEMEKIKSEYRKKISEMKIKCEDAIDRKSVV